MTYVCLNGARHCLKISTKICKHVSHTKQLFVDVIFFFFGFVYVLKNNKIKKLLLELRRLYVAQLNALKNIKGKQLHGKFTRYSPDDTQYSSSV